MYQNNRITNEEEKNISRRDALKTLVAVTGATALATLPNQWEKPVIEVGVLPVHAQSSISYPFTSLVERDGPGSGNRPIEEAGWVVVNVSNGTPTSIISNFSGSANRVVGQTIPIPRNARQDSAPPPTWVSTTTYTLAYTFISEVDIIPISGTRLWLYGVSGDLVFEATMTISIVNGVAIFDFPLPASYTGLFYFSANFVEEEIILTDSTEIDIRYYYAVGIYAELSIYVEYPATPPFLPTGTVTLLTANDPVNCDVFGDGIPGSLIDITVNYSGGDVTDGTSFNVFGIFYPSGNAYFLILDDPDITGSTVSTQVCLRFGSDSLLYLAASIVDASGIPSNWLASYLTPPIGVNLENIGDKPVLNKPCC